MYTTEVIKGKQGLRLIRTEYSCSLSTKILMAMVVIIIIINSSGDLPPSTAIANQLPGQLVYTQVTTRGPNCFKFIIALIMPSRNII